MNIKRSELHTFALLLPGLNLPVHNDGMIDLIKGGVERLGNLFTIFFDSVFGIFK